MFVAIGSLDAADRERGFRMGLAVGLGLWLTVTLKQ